MADKQKYFERIEANLDEIIEFSSILGNYAYLADPSVDSAMLEKANTLLHDKRRELIACKYAVSSTKDMSIAIGENALLHEEITELGNEYDIKAFEDIDIKSQNIKTENGTLASRYRLDVEEKLKNKIFGRLPKDQREFLKSKFLELDNSQTFEKLNILNQNKTKEILEGRCENDVKAQTEAPRKDYYKEINELTTKINHLVKGKIKNLPDGTMLCDILHNLCIAGAVNIKNKIQGDSLTKRIEQKEKTGEQLSVRDVAETVLIESKLAGDNDALIKAHGQLKDWVKLNDVEKEILGEKVGLAQHVSRGTQCASACTMISQDISKEKGKAIYKQITGQESKPEMKELLDKPAPKEFQASSKESDNSPYNRPGYTVVPERALLKIWGRYQKLNNLMLANMGNTGFCLGYIKAHHRSQWEKRPENKNLSKDDFEKWWATRNYSGTDGATMSTGSKSTTDPEEEIEEETAEAETPTPAPQSQKKNTQQSPVAQPKGAPAQNKSDIEDLVNENFEKGATTEPQNDSKAPSNTDAFFDEMMEKLRAEPAVDAHKKEQAKERALPPQPTQAQIEGAKKVVEGGHMKDNDTFMNAYDALLKKRQNEQLTANEMAFLIAGKQRAISLDKQKPPRDYGDLGI